MALEKDKIQHYLVFDGCDLIDQKDITGEGDYELLKYADSSRKMIFFMLQSKGAKGGDYFAGTHHHELSEMPEELEKFWSMIHSVDDFRRLSNEARHRMASILLEGQEGDLN